MSTNFNILLLALLFLIAQNSLTISAKKCVQLPIDESSEHKYGSMNLVEKIDDNIREQAFTASLQWNKKNTSWSNFFAVSCIINAQEQVVAGMIYKINVTITETECTKDLVKASGDLANCNHVDSGLSLNCLFSIYVRLPFLNIPPELNDYNCVVSSNIDDEENDSTTDSTTTESTTTDSTTTKSSAIIGGDFKNFKILRSKQPKKQTTQ